MKPSVERIRPDWGKALLLLFPVVLVVANPTWIFTYVSYIDPWVYFGYFQHLIEYKSSLFPDLYYGSRLPWLLPGYAAYHLLRPEIANYVLHFSFYYAAVFSMYDLLKRAAGPKNALVGALLFGGHGLFLRAIGWDYVDGAGCTYFLLASAAAARATEGRRWLWLPLCGMAAACMSYTNLVLVLLVPFVFALYVFIRFPGWNLSLARPTIEWVLWCGAGATVISVALGAINYAIDGNFWFYSPSFHYALGFYSHPNPWQVLGWKWMVNAYWLILPFAAAVGTLGYVFFAAIRRTLKRDFRTYFVLQFLAVAAGMLIAKIFGSSWFSYFYYTSYMIPPMFLAIGTMLDGAEDGRSETSGWVLAIATFALLVISARLSEGPFELWLRHWFSMSAVAILVALCLFVNGMFQKKRLVPLIAIAGVVFNGIAYDGLDTPSMPYKRYWLQAVEGADKLWPNEQKQPLLFWYNQNALNGFELFAINAIYLWGYTYIGPHYPVIEVSERLTAGRTIVMLTGTGSWFADVNDLLHRNHLEGTIVQTYTVGHDGQSFQISLVKLATYSQ